VLKKKGKSPIKKQQSGNTSYLLTGYSGTKPPIKPSTPRVVSKWNSDLGGVINYRLIHLYQKFNPEPAEEKEEEKAAPTRS